MTLAVVAQDAQAGDAQASAARTGSIAQLWPRPLLAALAVFAISAAAHGAEVVIYRCTDAKGAITLQNDVRCPSGSKQEKRIVDTPPPMPEYQPMPKPPPPPAPKPVAVAEPVAAPKPVPLAERTPPPALFTCKTFEQDTYFSDNGEAPPRCVPAQTTGIGGNTGLGAGEACIMLSDECAPVAEATLCETWKRRVNEAEFRWKFAKAGAGDPRKIEYDRLAKILGDSNCAP